MERDADTIEASGGRRGRDVAWCALLLGAAMFVAGCASGGVANGQGAGAGVATARAPVTVAADEAAVAPRDFELDILVLTGSRRNAGERVGERPMRLSISPDGSLHATVDDNVSGRTVPPRLRTLDQTVIAELWTTARTLGLLDPELDAPPVHPPAVDAGPDELVAVVSIRAEGRHRSIIARAGESERLPDDLSRYIRRLGALAWATDRPGEAVPVVPRRYDLGDDPYARYQRPGVRDRPGAPAG